MLCNTLIVSLAWSTGILVLVIFYQKWTSYRAFRAAAIQHGCKRPPKYPHREPIWGTDLVKIRMKAVKDGKQGKLYMEHFNNIGKTWEENLFGTRVYHTMEVQNVQHVAALGFQDYGKPDQNFFIPFLGEGILSMDGPAWKHSRSLVKPVFARSELSDVDTLGFHVDKFLDKLPRDGSTIDLQESLRKLFLDTSTEFLLGRSMDSQNPDDPNNSKEFLDAFMWCLAGVGKRRLVGKLHRIIYAFDTAWEQQKEKVYEYIDRHVNRALKETADEISKKASQDFTELSQPRYILLNEMAKDIKDPIKLRSEVLNVFMPGRDTTSILLGNCFFHLARNPTIWTQLREQSIALGDQPLTFELLKSLHLFRYVLHETLRLQGPAGRVQRRALQDTILPVGGGKDGKAPMLVRKGDIVALNTWGQNHDRGIWGDDVDEFKPQRFAGQKFGWEFTPFLGGPRICPAQQQVLTQSLYLLVRMTREFERIENRDPVLEYVEVVRMLTESRNGVKVGLIP